MDFESKVGRTHPLALLAEELKLIADRELNVFCSVLCHWCPESVIVSVVLLHQFYGERLVCLPITYLDLVVADMILQLLPLFLLWRNLS